MNRAQNNRTAWAPSFMQGQRNSTQPTVPDGGSAEAGSAQTSDADAFDPGEAHHHGETCSCNLRGE